MQARSRNLPRRQATPAHLLPGYVRPARVQQRPAVIHKRRPPRRQRNPLPRRRLTERSVHIMNQKGTLRSFVAPNTDMNALANSSETRVKLSGEIFDRLIWRASRKATIKLWISRPTFANLIFTALDEDDFKWTITKPKIRRGIVKGSTSTMRINLRREKFVEIFGEGSDVKRSTDENKIMYLTKIFNSSDDVARISYCLTTGNLTIRFFYKVWQVVVDPVTGVIDYLDM